MTSHLPPADHLATRAVACTTCKAGIGQPCFPPRQNSGPYEFYAHSARHWDYDEYAHPEKYGKAPLTPKTVTLTVTVGEPSTALETDLMAASALLGKYGEVVLS